jgi:hypothetical protein
VLFKANPEGFDEIENYTRKVSKAIDFYPISKICITSIQAFNSREFSMKLVSLLALLFVLNASANKAALYCRLEAFKATSNQSVLTSLIAKDLEGKLEDNRPGQLIIGKSIAYAKDASGKEKSLYVYVSMGIWSNDIRAEVRDSDTSALNQQFGLGVGKFVGQLSNNSQEVRLTVPLKGSITEGYLEDREDKKLVDFDAVELSCLFGPEENDHRR